MFALGAALLSAQISICASTPEFLKRSELCHTSRHRTWTHAAKCGDHNYPLAALGWDFLEVPVVGSSRSGRYQTDTKNTMPLL